MEKRELLEMILKGEDSYDELPVPGTSLDDLAILYFRRFFENFYQAGLDEFSLPRLLENRSGYGGSQELRPF